MSIILSSGKRDFILDPIMTNVSGTLGFSDEAAHYVELSSLGAFITNPLSLNPRTVARPPRLVPFPGGFLLHTGHPNPGLQRAIQRHQRRWKDLPCPVIVHILGQNSSEVTQIVERLEDVEAVVAVELGLEVSDSVTISDLTTAAAMSELPVIAHIPMDCSDEMVTTVVNSGATALSLGPPRGCLPGPGGNLIHGRLYGPALYPLALKAIAKWSEFVEIPLFASGGVSNHDQINALLTAGAQAVQLDSVLWTEPERILAGISASTDNNQTIWDD